MDIQKFREDYESSGKSQKAYGKQIGMSASMVSYYLRKSQKPITRAPEQGQGEGEFREIKFNRSILSKQITITTPDGVQINIPI